MINKMMDKVKAHHVWRFIVVIVVFVLVVIICAFYLFLHLLSIFVEYIS